jgi:hypothetical protein
VLGPLQTDPPSAPGRGRLVALAAAVLLAVLTPPARAQCTNPAAPANPTPANAATVSGSTVLFAWSAVAGTAPVSYQVLLDGLNVACTTTATSCQLTGVVGSHSWRVSATNPCGSASGGPWTFTVSSGQNCVKPSAPANPSPASGTAVTSGTVQLVWSASSGTAPVTYTVYLDTLASAPKCSATATSCTVSGLKSGNHWWWVKAGNCGGESSSGPWTIVVNLPCEPAGAPAPVSPADGAVGVGAAPRLAWQEPAGSAPFAYDVLLDGARVAACSAIAATTCDLAGLPIDAALHTWTVTAKNACGNASSASRTFTTCAATAPPVPAIAWLEQGPLAFGGMQQAQPYAGQTVHLRGSASLEPTAWRWELGDGMARTGQNPTFVWPVPGSYQVTLAATNCFGASAPVGATVVVYADVRPVTADFSWSPEAPEAGSAVTFVAGDGYGLGDPAAFEWTFPGDVRKSGRIVSHVFSCAGTDTVTLVASRGTVVSSPTTRAVTTGGAPLCCRPPNRAGAPVPAVGATVPGGAVTLQWARPSQGTDPLAYDVWLDGARVRECTSIAARQCVVAAADGAATHVWKVIARNPCGDTTTFPDTAPEWRFKACAAPSAPDAATFSWQPSGVVEVGGVAQQQPYVGQAVTFSYDPAVAATSVQWTDYQRAPAVVYDGVAHPAVVYAAPGDRKMYLKASNCAGTTYVTRYVTVFADQRPVTAAFTVSPPAPGALDPMTVTFDTSPAAGDPNEFTVDFGDGAAAQTTRERSLQHVYRCARSYRIAVTARRVKTGSAVASNPTGRDLTVTGTACSPTALLLVDLPRRVERAGRAAESGGVALFNPGAEPLLLALAVRDADSGQLRQALELPQVPARGVLSLDDVTALLGLDFKVATLWLRNLREGATELPVVTAWRYQEPRTGTRYWQHLPVISVWPPSDKSATLWLNGLRHDSVNAERSRNGFVTRLTLVDPTITDVSRAPWGAKKLALTLLDSRTGAVLRSDSLSLDATGGYRSDYLNRFFHLPDAQDLDTVAVRVDVPAGVSAVATASVLDAASGSTLVLAATP